MPKGVYEHKKGYKLKPRTEEQKNKISKSHKGLKQSPETIEKRVSKLRGKKRFITEEWRKNMSLAKIGTHRSEETKRKIGLFWKGKKQSKERIEQRAKKLRGQKRTEEAKKKMCEAHKGQIPWNKDLKGFMSGKAHHWWKGDKMKDYPILKQLRNSLEYKQWRVAVFKRDNYTCLWCGQNRGGNLNADHIKPFALYPELRFDINNGRTLCVDCHKKTDTYAGKQNIKQTTSTNFNTV